MGMGRGGWGDGWVRRGVGGEVGMVGLWKGMTSGEGFLLLQGWRGVAKTAVDLLSCSSRIHLQN